MFLDRTVYGNGIKKLTDYHMLILITMWRSPNMIFCFEIEDILFYAFLINKNSLTLTAY